jgi:hypothetical protein
MRLAEHVGSLREIRNAYKILVRTLEGKRPLGIPRRKWEDNIKMNLRKMGIEGVDWIHLAQDKDQCWAFVNTIMNFFIP